MAENSRDRNAKPDTALVTELMGLDMLNAFEDRRVRIPREGTYYDALRKPQRVVKGNREVRLAAERDEDGHADEFWSLALLIKSFKTPPGLLTTTDGVRMAGGIAGRARFTPRRLGARPRSESDPQIALISAEETDHPEGGLGAAVRTMATPWSRQGEHGNSFDLRQSAQSADSHEEALLAA